MSTPSAKPKWLVLGGLGFLGRNIVKYLVDNGLASDIRIVDKKAPFMAFLSPDYKAAIMENPIVECVQADISDEEMCANAFRESRAGGPWDYVLHAAAETALGKREEFYQKTVDGAVRAGTIAASMGVKKYVFLSTAHVYKSSSSAVKEDGKVGPWTAVAEACLRAEQALQGVQGLQLIILRPALVYGPGDFTTGLMPRAVVAAAYKVRAWLWLAVRRC
jgi:nucleoside-diphosphate-sugar epimerase